jgi:ankyrin repeat domain-containing protein 17
VRVIRAAKETQAARANQNATILLEELESERCREESRRQAAARRRERKKKKKLEKKVPHPTSPFTSSSLSSSAH